MSIFYKKTKAVIEALGGHHNAHLHLDRAHTLDDGYVDHGRVQVLASSHLSLQKKHALIRSVHDGPAYDHDNFMQRLETVTQEMIDAGTRLADTVVDVTPDRVGTSALEWINSYKATVADKITIRTASYSPLGFDDAEPERWNIFERGAAQSDFIGSLPEKDDRADYPSHIGFDEHCRRVLTLARSMGKMLQVHTDQRNIPQEDGTERLLNVIAEDGPFSAEDGAPLVWAVHMISPSTYDEARWIRFVERLKEMNVGVISCPSAAIGMRAIRAMNTPTYNAIPRLLELSAAGIPIRLGSDNIADMCSPSTTADLMDEVFILSAAIRYYEPTILGKFAAGVALTNDERASIAEHLARNNEEIARVVQRWVD